MKIAIVTVSSDSFLDGTMVLFRSFLNHNKWFKGDLITIDGGLSKKSKARMADKFNVIVRAPEKEIDVQLDKLISDFPKCANRRSRFYSIDAFNINGYDYLLFLDSDVLCTNDVEELFKNNYFFAASPDRGYYWGYIRHLKSFNLVEKSAKTELFKEHFTDNFFNTGVMLIHNSVLVPGFYKKLVEALTFKTFEHIQTGHTDTVVLNNELLSKVNWLDFKYNFYTTLLNTHIPEFTEDVKPYFVHFIRKHKPWNNDAPQNKWFTEWHNTNKQLNENN